MGVVAIKGLQRLALLAASLPIVPVVAEEPPEPSLTFAYHAYEEDGTTGYVEDFDRYNIDVFQGRFVFSAGARKVISVDSTVDSMSGASPWYSRPDSEGEPVVVSSPSPISDRRIDMNVNLTHYGEGEPGEAQWITSGMFGVSDEDDYFSVSLGLSQGYEFWGRNIRLNYGTDVSLDEVSPEGIAGSPSVFDTRTRRRWNIFSNLSLVVGENTQMSGGIAMQQHSGYLTDPYKQVFDLSVGASGGPVAESRPSTRQSLAMSFDVRHYFPDSAIAFQGGYRFFDDDWGVDAHTFDFAWVKAQGSYEWLWGLRYYSQQAALFYSPFFGSLPASGSYSSDYRLSDFGAISARLGLARQFESSKVQVLVERYDSGNVFQLQPARFINTDPGLVDYWRVSIEVNINL